MINQHQHKLFIILAALLLGLSLVFGPTQSAKAQDAIPTIYYVIPGGTGDCTSWSSACDLQTALTSASSGSEIWVAAGTYQPTADTTDRTATFQLKNGVVVYGGFAGTETARDQRDWQGNVVILSGDIDNNDSQSPITDLSTVTGNTTNSYHVAVGATGATLDGVTITAGYANNAVNYNDLTGGGMVNHGSSPVLTHVNFQGNSAGGGGGMYNDQNASPVLTDVTFAGNAANLGGGLMNDSSSPALTHVTFRGNSATRTSGGGMYNSGGSPVLTDVTFESNSAASSGGGMDTRGGSLVLMDVTFQGNLANSGGGVMIYGSSVALTHVTFNGNSATLDGGGIYIESGVFVNLVFMDVTFEGNTAARNGGGIYDGYISSPMLTNTTFHGNSAVSGGGMYTGYYPSPIPSNPVIKNSIFWGDTGGEISSDPAASTRYNPTIISSVIEEGCPQAGAGSTVTCTNVISTDPLLGPLGNYGGSTQTIPLLPGSSAIDAGDSSACPTTDQRGHARVGICDIGAFEYDYSGTYYVKPGGSGTKDGQSWDNASDLQNALKTARSGDEIWVAAGTYRPTADTTDRTATFQLKDGVAIYGGFAGTETAREERDWVTNVVILSGDIDNNDSQSPITNLSTVTGNTTNSYHVVVGATGATLDGVTITAGYANNQLEGDNGGGIYNQGTLTVANVTLSGNSADSFGGAIWNDGSLTVTDSTFTNNSGGFDGAIYNDPGGTVNVTGSTFTNNSGVYGGAIANDSVLNLTDSTFSNNSAYWGGGIYNDPGGTLTVTNSTFTNNSGAYGGAILNDGGLIVTVAGSTLSKNSASAAGGGIYNGEGTLTVTNSIFVDNHAQAGGGIINSDGTLTVTDSTFSNNSGDNGGGIYNFSHAAQAAMVTNSTFAGNDSQAIYNGLGSVTLRNSLLVKGSGSNCHGTIGGTNNLADDDSCGATGFTNSPTILLGSLGNYGGSTETIPLLPGSPAIDAGNAADCTIGSDQRGVPYVGTCDIGAFESQGFTLGSLTGTPQSATINTAFAAPLGLTVTANNAVEPVDGGVVTFAASAEGASAVLSGSPAIISGGTVSVPATANGIPGSYSVTASTAGAADATFALTNTKMIAAVSLSNLIQIYDGGPKPVTVTTDPAGLTVDVIYNESGTTPSNAGTYAVVATVNDALYQGTASATLTIQPRDITVKADDKTKVVGDPDPTLTYQIINGALAFGDAFSGALARDPGETVGSYAITQGTLALSSNYNLTFVPGTLTIIAPSVQADLSLDKTDSKDPVKPGATLVYTLTVTNLGPNTAQSVTLVDTLDRNTTYVSVSAPKGWTCNYANYKVTCTSASLASGSSAIIKITVTVNKTAKLGKDLINNAAVSSITYDPVTTNNSVVQKTLVTK